MRRLLPVVCALVAWCLAAACGSGTFYAELEEPQLCTTVYDAGFPGTQPGSDLIGVSQIPLGDIATYFHAAKNTTVDLELTSLSLDAGAGITDFNGIDSAAVALLQGNLDGGSLPDGGYDLDAGIQIIPLLSYQQNPNDLPYGTLTIANPQPINLANYLDSNGNIDVVAIMDGGLPVNAWSADVRACFYLRARIDYLQQWGE